MLLIVGSQADTKYMSEDAYHMAISTQEKELYEIKNATHIQTYYVKEVVDEAINKLDIFYQTGGN